MKPIYFSELELVILSFVLAVALAALAGFAVGLIYSDNRRITDMATPKHEQRKTP